jgi:hypothetical protein
MLLFGLGLVAAGLVHASTEAPITAVTVYSDRARVVRTATLNVSGTQRFELPRLPDLVDPDSIRVEAQGAEVSSVDVRPASAPPFPEEQARKVLGTLDTLDQSIARLEAERAAYTLQVTALRRVQPVKPDEDEPRTTAPAAWGIAAAFLVDTAAKLEQRLLELEDRVLELQDERKRRLSEAERLGERPGKPGIEVAVTLAGSGAAKLQVSYMVPQHVRWYPRYELQLQPEHQRVQVAFSGSVSQNTGEDWENAKLTLSTALPSNATSLPQLATWKIGTTERFIPEPTRRRELVGAPPPLPPRAEEQDLEYELRTLLLARVGKPPPSREKPAPRTPADAGTQRSYQSQPSYAAPQSSESYSSSTRGTTINGSRGTLLGVVIDAQTRQPVPDVVITATSPSLPGEETVVSDAQGQYRIPFLPQGAYTLRFEKEQSKPYARSDIHLRGNSTLRINVELLPESLGEVVEIVGAPPTIDVGSAEQGMGFSLHSPPSSGYSRPIFQSEPVVDSYVGLAPPPGWVPPALKEDMPAVLAGGYDLAFTAPRLETVRSGHGERTVPLLIESWPVQTERHVFPALAMDAYLVAQLKSPSRSVLPAGMASLSVGADPVGTAMLKLVVPGEPFILPLGVDPAVRTVRNVRLVQSKDGFISKDDINTYEVTLEVPNPYAFPLQVRVVDQWPLTQNDKVEVKLVRTSPGAKQDDKTGELQWDLVVPPSGKKTVSFEYSLRRPLGWRLTQHP